MHIIRHHAAIISVITVCILCTSCLSDKTNETIDPEETAEQTAPAVKEIPQYVFQGDSLKIEMESLFMNDFLVYPETNASGGYAARLMTELSTAKAVITFPAGIYEGFAAELAPDKDHTAFYMLLDDKPYRIYTADPPAKTWELTTRCPVYFVLDHEQTLQITVQANSAGRNGNTDMALDYLVFLKKQ